MLAVDFFHVDCAITLKRIYVFVALESPDGSRQARLHLPSPRPRPDWCRIRGREALAGLAIVWRPSQDGPMASCSQLPAWALEALADVYDPCCREKGISVVDMGLLRSITVTGGHARVELLLTSGWCPFAARVLDEVSEAVAAQPGVESCEVEIVWDETWTTDRLSESATRKLRFLPDPADVPDRDAYLKARHRQIEEAS
jgi:metal-sulfur cluster biosynthetic enzyme